MKVQHNTMIYDCLIFYEKQKEWERQTNSLSAWTRLRFCFLFWLVKKIGQLFIKTSLQGTYIMMIICNGPSLPFAMSALLGLFAFDKSLVYSEACLENILVNCGKRNFDTLTKLYY